MYGTPTKHGAAGGMLATTGVALNSWVLAGIGLCLLALVLLFVTARRHRS
jgi:LPXTG-motif cell wall-anchored protein